MKAFIFPCLLFVVTSSLAQQTTGGIALTPSPAGASLTMFGRGMYPGNDTVFKQLSASGFTTLILSSFYIHADGDLYCGDDNTNPIIHNGHYTGSKEWFRRIASLKQQPGSVTRIELLLEGRWINQPANTFDFIRDWSDSAMVIPGITTGTGVSSTLYKIAKALKDEVGIDAVCIDDEAVYNSPSIVRLGAMIGGLNMHMTLCPYTNDTYWKDIISGSGKSLIDAVYLQCYDGGAGNAPGAWKNKLATNIPVYPIFMCRGSFDTCSSIKGSLTPAAIKAEMIRFRKAYPGMTGGAIWQMADVISYVNKHCAVQNPESGSATSVSQFLSQLKNSLKEGL